MLNIPRTITVLGQTFRVEVALPNDPLFRGADHDALGGTDLNHQIIKLRGPEEMSEAQALETLVHEVLHAVFYTFGLRHHVRDHHDEELVGVLAPALIHTLRNNPDLVTAITTAATESPTNGEVHLDD